MSYFDFFGYSKPKLKQIDLIRSLGLYFDFFEYRKPKLILIDLKNLNYQITWIIFDFFGSSKPKLKQINLIRSLGLYFDFFGYRKPKLIKIDLNLCYTLLMIITPSLQTTADISNSTYNCTANNQHNPYKSRILTNILTFVEN